MILYCEGQEEMRVLRGKEVRNRIFKDIEVQIKNFEDSPRLLSIVIGDDPASVAYSNAKGRKAAALGVMFKCLNINEKTSQEDAEGIIKDEIKNFDPDGIIIETPVPGHLDFVRLTNLIPPYADVDCQRMDNLGRLLSGNPLYIPATPGAVLEILKHYDIETEGKDIVIVGRSMTVGMPLSVLLLRKSSSANATVTVCHSRTKNLREHSKRADILIVAAGRPGLIDAEMTSPKSIIIDVGTNYIDGKLVGDVDFESISEKVSAATPVPGGVGPVTTAFLLKNLVYAYERKRNKIKHGAGL